MKHIFKKLHKSHEPNRTNETLIPSTSAIVSSTDADPPLPSTASQSQQLCSSDQTSSTSVQSPETPSSEPVPQAPPPVASIPTTLGGGVGDEGPGLGNHVDYFSSEEEFQIQLALAISASNSDIKDDPENDQIRAATLLSLGRAKTLSSVREKEVSGESLSRRYWDYNVLDYEEKVVDGFYDVYGLTVEPIVQGKMPCLADLETSPGDSGYEAVIVNRKIDPTLEELEQVARCIAIDCPPSEIGIRVQRLAELVTDHMGGSVSNPNIMLARWMDRSSELRTSLHTSVFPIGTLKTGISRHRALLFKVLADNVGIRCRLIKGSHYTGVEEDAVNIIKLEDGREFLVDLMAAPGTLLPTDVLSAKDLTQPTHQNLDSKAPYGQESNGCGTLHPEAKALVGNSFARANDSAESKLLVSGNTTSETAGPSHLDTGTGPTRINTKSNSANQMEFPSTSAVGASLYKANRGPLAVGDGSKLRMNVNVVPNYQNNVDESRKLFADLNPFQIGGGRLMQNKPPDYRLDEPRRQKTDSVSSNPSPMMWKNRHVVNEAPKKKEYNFPEGLPPRNCGDTSVFLNKVSLPVQSCSTSSDNNCVNISKRNLDSAQTSRCQDVERFHNVPSIAAVAKQSDTLLVGGKKYTQDCTQGQAIESDNMSNPRKGYDNRVIGPQDHQKCTFNRFMDTSLLPNGVGSGLPTDCGPSCVDTGIDDVGECEIPWEDLDLGERIGLGSYGEVYRADWNGTEVAVKKFLDQDFSGAALAEFKREVRIMRRLRHPNVVLFMGAVTRPPNLSIITEFLPRGSLYRLIHRPNCQIDEKHRVKMALDVARGMNCLHSSTPTIVHRDLKSPNLLVDNSWNVKVCDFGLSRLKHNTFLSSKSTAGTPEWMAPEVLRNEPSNEKCDIYSFGVILWELATLRLPWSGMNPMQVVGAVGFQNRRLEIPKEVDPLVARIIWECWQTDPNLRPSFAQLCVALKPLQLLVIPSTNLDQQSSSMHQEISVNSTP